MLTLPTIAQSELDVRPIDWCGLPKRFLNPGEGEVLAALMRSVQARRVVEIGCNDGRTAKLMLRNVPTIDRYIGIDVPPGYEFLCSVQKNEVPARPGRHALEEKGFELLLRPRGSFDVHPVEIGEADVVFIDGDHSAPAVHHDTQLARRVLRPGGLIIWHDYHDLGTVDVRDMLHAFVMGGTARPVHVEDTWIAIERISEDAARLAA
jgi:predicted O-methyltransferase YrrM